MIQEQLELIGNGTVRKAQWESPERPLTPAEKTAVVEAHEREQRYGNVSTLNRHERRKLAKQSRSKRRR